MTTAHRRLGRLGVGALLVGSLGGAAACGPPGPGPAPAYRIEALALPPGVTSAFPRLVDDEGRIYATGTDGVSSTGVLIMWEDADAEPTVLADDAVGAYFVRNDRGDYAYVRSMAPAESALVLAGGEVVSLPGVVTGLDDERRAVLMAVGPERGAAIWDDGTLTPIVPPRPPTTPFDTVIVGPMNDEGMILGTVGSYLGTTPFLWRDDVSVALEPLPGGHDPSGADVNAHGQVVGASGVTGGHTAVRWDGGGVPTGVPGLPGGGTSSAHAINDAGDIVGVTNAPGDPGRRTWLRRDGRTVDLGSLGGGTTDPIALTEGGAVVGRTTTGAAWVTRGFVWRDGVMAELGSLGGLTVDPGAVNEAGVVAGAATDADEVRHVAVWYPTGGAGA